ncbi:MAG: biopolymer transporter ExbD [Gemmataceae bacterium]
MSSPWRIRHSGSPHSIEVPSANRVVVGLRDGEWEASDEVLGPGEQSWKAIEDHVAFAEICEDLEPVKPEPPDETRLDMNPLIDVSLVLLIFFILTTTYASLRRSIELPDAPTDKAKATQPKKKDDVKDRVFKLKVWVEDDETKIKIEEQLVREADLEKELKEVIGRTGKREMFLDIDPDTPWGVEAKVYDAARGADVRQIYWPKNRK